MRPAPAISAWAQSVTRTRWLTVKAGWLLVAAAACGGTLAALTTWVVRADQRAVCQRVHARPVRYSGHRPHRVRRIRHGARHHRGHRSAPDPPAIAVTLGGFIALRLVISDFLRQHYMAAVTTYYNVADSFTPPGQAWVLAQGRPSARAG